MDIRIVDVSARDGLQNEPNAAMLPATVKAAFIGKLADCGLTRIEAGSFVRPAAVPAMANSAEVAELLKPVQEAHPNVIFSYLVPNMKGLERAKAIGAKEIAIFLAVSEKFAHDNINAPSVDQSFADIVPTVQAALAAGMRVRGYLSTVFGYTDMKFSPDKVALRTQQLLEMGCYEASLGDTTGIGTPETTATLVNELKQRGVKLERVALHFHDTFGKAIGNVDKSYDLGIRTFDAATGGLGGCPYAHSPKGNLAMEDLVRWALARGLSCEVRDVEKLAAAGQFMRERLGK